MEMFIQFVQTAWLPLLLSIVTAYLLGSFDFAIIVTKLIAKEDIREKGSGNAGATNVLRAHGIKMALLTTIGDLAKSIASLLLAEYLYFPMLGCAEYGRYGAYVAGLFCIVGHLFPLYFGFRGGKGVMTTLGMMLVLDWQVALVCVALFAVLVAISKMVSLGSVLTSAFLVVATFVKLKYITPVDDTQLLFCTGMTVIVAALLIVKHKTNIKRILNGTENKLGSKKA